MKNDNYTDLQKGTQAANRNTVEREHFPRWNKMVREEKARQEKERKQINNGNLRERSVKQR